MQDQVRRSHRTWIGCTLVLAWVALNLIWWSLLAGHIRYKTCEEFQGGTADEHYSNSLYSVFKYAAYKAEDISTIFLPECEPADFAQGRDFGLPLATEIWVPALICFVFVACSFRSQRVFKTVSVPGKLALYVIGIVLGAYASFDRTWSWGWWLTVPRTCCGIVVSMSLIMLLSRLSPFSYRLGQMRFMNLIRLARDFWALLTVVSLAVIFVLAATLDIFAKEYRQFVWKGQYHTWSWLMLREVSLWSMRTSMFINFDSKFWYCMKSDVGEVWFRVLHSRDEFGHLRNTVVVVDENGDVDLTNSRFVERSATYAESEVRLFDQQGNLWITFNAWPNDPTGYPDTRFLGMRSHIFRRVHITLKRFTEESVPPAVRQWIESQAQPLKPQP